MRFASSGQTTNWADSRLKFKRNFLHILQKLYLLLEPEHTDGEKVEQHELVIQVRKREFLQLIEHLIRFNSQK